MLPWQSLKLDNANIHCQLKGQLIHDEECIVSHFVVDSNLNHKFVVTLEWTIHNIISRKKGQIEHVTN